MILRLLCAILAGALGYAIATVTARRLPAGSALVTSAGVMLLGSIFMAPFAVAGLNVPDPGIGATVALVQSTTPDGPRAVTMRLPA